MTDILFISRQRVLGRTNGSSVYLLDLADAARNAGFTPHLIQPAPSMMGRMPVMRLKPDLGVFASHRVRGVTKLGPWLVSRDWRAYAAVARAGVAAIARRAGLGAAWTVDRPLPYSISIAWSAADRAFLRRHGRGDIVIADYMFQAEGFAALAKPGSASAIVMHDLFHARDTAAGGRDSVAVVGRADELAMLGRADAVIAIQAAEAGFLARELPATRVILAPMAAHPVAAPQPGDAGRLLFVGSNTAPNIVGLRWLFDAVWPRVRVALPDARLEIAGTVARAFPGGGPDGVTFLGLVDDLDARYAAAGVVLSPLTFGSGLKIKLIEALSRGKAIVATAVTLQGVEEACAGALVRADAADAFADAILLLARDETRRAALAAAALAAARRHFSPDACYGDFVAWLRAAASGDQTRR